MVRRVSKVNNKVINPNKSVDKRQTEAKVDDTKNPSSPTLPETKNKPLIQFERQQTNIFAQHLNQRPTTRVSEPQSSTQTTVEQTQEVSQTQTSTPTQLPRRQEMYEYMNKYNELTGKISELKERITVLREHISQLENEITTLERNLSDLQRRNIPANSPEYQEIVQRLARLKNQLATLKADLSNSEAELNSSKEELSRLEDNMYNRLIDTVPQEHRQNQPNRPNIVGLRYHRNEDRRIRRYDDVIAVLWIDEEGKRHVRVFHAATHSGQGESDQAPASGIARLQPGTYMFTIAEPTNKYPYKHLKSVEYALPVYRDRNQDGRITGDELRRTYRGTGILFHKGGRVNTTTRDGIPVGNVQNIGCQTIPPGEYEEFINLLIQMDLDGVQIPYTLVYTPE